MARGHWGGRRLPQAAVSAGTLAKTWRLEGRKFSQGSGGGCPGLMRTWLLLQGIGLEGRERVTYWCQDRGEGTQSLESLGHLRFLSHKVAMFHSPPVLIIRKLQQTQPWSWRMPLVQTPERKSWSCASPGRCHLICCPQHRNVFVVMGFCVTDCSAPLLRSFCQTGRVPVGELVTDLCLQRTELGKLSRAWGWSSVSWKVLWHSWVGFTDWNTRTI